MCFVANSKRFSNFLSQEPHFICSYISVTGKQNWDMSSYFMSVFLKLLILLCFRYIMCVLFLFYRWICERNNIFGPTASGRNLLFLFSLFLLFLLSFFPSIFSFIKIFIPLHPFVLHLLFFFFGVFVIIFAYSSFLPSSSLYLSSSCLLSFILLRLFLLHVLFSLFFFLYFFFRYYLPSRFSSPTFWLV